MLATECLQKLLSDVFFSKMFLPDGNRFSLVSSSRGKIKQMVDNLESSKLKKDKLKKEEILIENKK